MRAGIRSATVFPLKAVGWSLGLFAVLRSSWVEGAFVLPLTHFQQGAAEFYAGRPRAPMAVTVDCSGADVLALCLAAILAWPATWRARLAGALGAMALIMALNTVRIGTLGRAAGSPELFETLHLQVWPALLVLATAGYVFAWMRTTVRVNEPASDGAGEGIGISSTFSGRFGALTALSLIIFAFSGPAVAHSETLLIASVWVAGAGAVVLNAAGVAAGATGAVLTTSRGSFMVTPECLATALVPLYVAGVFAAPLTWPRRAMALLAAPPFFATLAIARVLLLALPPVIAASPLFLVHGFHQIVLALMVVASLVWRREPLGYRRGFRAARRAAAAIATGGVFAVLLGSALTVALLGLTAMLTPLAPHALSELTGPGDDQGALATLFAFQTSFLLALGVSMIAGWKRLLPSLAALFLIQALFLVALVEIADRTGALPHALLLRAWAVGLPLALAFAMLRNPPPLEIPLLEPLPHGPA